MYVTVIKHRKIGSDQDGNAIIFKINAQNRQRERYDEQPQLSQKLLLVAVVPKAYMLSLLSLDSLSLSLN